MIVELENVPLTLPDLAGLDRPVHRQRHRASRASGGDGQGNFGRRDRSTENRAPYLGISQILVYLEIESLNAHVNPAVGIKRTMGVTDAEASGRRYWRINRVAAGIGQASGGGEADVADHIHVAKTQDLAKNNFPE